MTPHNDLAPGWLGYVSDVEVLGKDVCTLLCKNLGAPMGRNSSPQEHVGLKHAQTVGINEKCRCYKFRVNLILKNLMQSEKRIEMRLEDGIQCLI